jgi:outer membrane protein TolC
LGYLFMNLMVIPISAALFRIRSRLASMRYRGGVDTQLNTLDADRDLFDADLKLTLCQ